MRDYVKWIKNHTLFELRDRREYKMTIDGKSKLVLSIPCVLT